MPRVPLVQGVWRMLFTGEVLARWVALSVTLTGAGWFLSWVLNAMGRRCLLRMPMFAVGCVFSGVWLLSALPVMLGDRYGELRRERSTARSAELDVV